MWLESLGFFMIAILIFWNLFAAACGAQDAGIFAHGVAHQIKERQPYNIHAFLNIPRGVVWTFFVFILSDLPPIQHGIASISLLLQFSMFHNGTYYQTRHYLDGVPGYHFFTSKNQTTARISFGAVGRVLLWVLGLVGCLVMV